MKDTRIYKQINGCSISTDIYYAGSNSPIIIYIHGGALIFGTREWLSTEQIEYFTNAGFSLINIDYRLAPETDFEQIINDIQDAVEWVRSKTAEWYDFDTSRIAIMGSSAGGYLSLLAGTMKIKSKAIVSLYGYGDILGTWYTRASDFYCKKPIIKKDEAMRYIGSKEITNGEWDRINYYIYCRQNGIWVQEVTKMDPVLDSKQLTQYCPIHNISNNYPPAIFLHGDRDTDVPYEQSLLMYNKLKENGVNTELITIENADHVFDQHFNDPQVQSAFQSIVRFLNTHLLNCKT